MAGNSPLLCYFPESYGGNWGGVTECGLNTIFLLCNV